MIREDVIDERWFMIVDDQWWWLMMVMMMLLVEVASGNGSGDGGAIMMDVNGDDGDNVLWDEGTFLKRNFNRWFVSMFTSKKKQSQSSLYWNVQLPNLAIVGYWFYNVRGMKGKMWIDCGAAQGTVFSDS